MDRLFLAIPVRLYDYVALKEAFDPLVQGRWIPEEQLHVTLLFLGGRYAAKDVIERLEALDRTFLPLPFEGLSYFGKSRILHAHVTNPTLQVLHERVGDALRLPRERFTPHVTLMRVKRLQDKEAFAKRLKAFVGHPTGILAPELTLQASALRPEGAVYRTLKRWPL